MSRWTEGVFVVPEELVAYRSRHVIDVVYTGPDKLARCRHCGLRVLRRRSGARPLLWRHDPDQVKELVRISHGG